VLRSLLSVGHGGMDKARPGRGSGCSGSVIVAWLPYRSQGSAAVPIRETAVLSSAWRDGQGKVGRLAGASTGEEGDAERLGEACR